MVSELVESARNHDYTDVVMIHEHRGEPDGLVVCHMPYGPCAYFGIFNTVYAKLYIKNVIYLKKSLVFLVTVGVSFLHVLDIGWGGMVGVGQGGVRWGL